jgi:hypothetical protein
MEGDLGRERELNRPTCQYTNPGVNPRKRATSMSRLECQKQISRAEFDMGRY